MTGDVAGGSFGPSAAAASAAVERAARWLSSTRDRTALQAGARRFAMTVARAVQLALLAEYGGAMQDHIAINAAQDWCKRLCRAGIDSIHDCA